uniref:WD_REPEATS_REGION domain-containing protein n=1 Tax=Caenorhabditis tropicalis TaxID=1561998 RepID=A0A1I7U5X9_9PELO
MILRGHERAVECVSVNTDSTRAISGSVDTNLKVWNLEASDEATIYEKEEEENAKKRRKKETKTKVPMVTIGGHRDKVSAIEWCPWKAGHAFSSSYDHTIVEWDLELAGEVSRIKGPKSFTDISIHSTSGLIISSCTDAIPRLYDPKNRDGTMVKQSFIGHQNEWVESVKWNPLDANQFVSVSTDRTDKMWDIRSSKSSLFDIHGHEDRILCAAWNERLIATGSADCTIKVLRLPKFCYHRFSNSFRSF